ncbi:hypothetical protein C8J57DRAFT_558977 [Mycena rebaudengoi]|nr:hypothetical protein C8J57DRAFT_558977 [Mycena rebaudengoi]
MPPRANRSATPTTTTTGTTPPTGTPFTTATTSSKRRTQALRIHRPPLPDPELEEAGVDEPRMEEQERASPSKYPTPLPDEGSLTPVEEAEATPPTPEEVGGIVGEVVGGEVEAVVRGIEVEARVDKDEPVVEKQQEAVAGTKGNEQRKSREENTAHLRAPEAPRCVLFLTCFFIFSSYLPPFSSSNSYYSSHFYSNFVIPFSYSVTFRSFHAFASLHSVRLIIPLHCIAFYTPRPSPHLF